MTSTESSALGRAKQLVRRVRPRSRDEQPRLDEVAARLNRQHGRIAAVERELARIGPQVAAIEVRLEDLRQRLDQPGSNDAERAEAASLVEEIRREHQRIRARISAATRYEERLRQLEETVSRLGADRPQPTG